MKLQYLLFALGDGIRTVSTYVYIELRLASATFIACYGVSTEFPVLKRLRCFFPAAQRAANFNSHTGLLLSVLKDGPLEFLSYA